MDDWLTSFAKPAIAVALLSVTVHGAKAFVDLLGQVRGRRISREQSQIAYVAALLKLVDDLPMARGRQIVLKVKVARTLLPGGLPSFFREEIDALEANET